MSSDKPKPFDRALPHQQAGFRQALAAPDTWAALERGVPLAQGRTIYRKLSAIRSGLMEWRTAEPALSQAALEGRIMLRKVERFGQWEFQVLVKSSPRRPSDIAREFLAALERGESATPPRD